MLGFHLMLQPVLGRHRSHFPTLASHLDRLSVTPDCDVNRDASLSGFLPVSLDRPSMNGAVQEVGR